MNANNDFEILELSTFKITGLSIVLTWKWVSGGKEIEPPINLLEYRIYCDGKELEYKYNPPLKNQWYFILDRLKYNTTYKVFIKSFDKSKKTLLRSNEIEVTTKARPRWSKFRFMPIESKFRVDCEGYFSDVGVDLYVVIGTPCIAINGGKVTHADDDINDKKVDKIDKVGKKVVISFKDNPIPFGKFKITNIFYTHLNSFKINNTNLKKGQDVSIGTQIGESGQWPPPDWNDNRKPAPHLHFGIGVDKPNYFYLDNKQFNFWGYCLSRDQVYELLNLEFGQILKIPFFYDVPETHWAYKYIHLLQRNGYISGKEQFKYNPIDNLTRAEMAVLCLKGYYGPSFKPTISTAGRFNDVGEGQKNEWYFKWVNECAKKGFISGYPDGKYYPNKFVTRAEATVYFLRVKMGPNYTPDLTTVPYEKIPEDLRFEDVPIRQWYFKWVYAAIFSGIALNCDEPERKKNNCFRPDEELTRAEAACMMFQTLQAKGIIPKDL